MNLNFCANMAGFYRDSPSYQEICDRACEDQPSGRIKLPYFSTLPFHKS